MKLDQAIRRLDYIAKAETIIYLPADYEAIRLGSEALKRVLNSRVEPRYSSVDPLPGETKE